MTKIEGWGNAEKVVSRRLHLRPPATSVAGGLFYCAKDADAGGIGLVARRCRGAHNG